MAAPFSSSSRPVNYAIVHHLLQIDVDYTFDISPFLLFLRLNRQLSYAKWKLVLGSRLKVLHTMFLMNILCFPFWIQGYFHHYDQDTAIFWSNVMCIKSIFGFGGIERNDLDMRSPQVFLLLYGWCTMS